MGFEALDGDLVSKLVAATEGGSHAVLCLAPSVAAFKSAVAISRRGGTIVMVGLPKGELPLPIFDVVLRGITVRGSIVGACVLTYGFRYGSIHLCGRQYMVPFKHRSYTQARART